VHRPQSVVYKVDYFVLRTLSISLVLLNTKVYLLSYSKNLSHNNSLSHYHYQIYTAFLGKFLNISI